MSSLIMMVAPTPARRDHHAGAHNVATLVPRHWEHLWAGTLDVSQPLLDADMERHHCAWLGRVKRNARHRLSPGVEASRLHRGHRRGCVEAAVEAAVEAVRRGIEPYSRLTPPVVSVKASRVRRGYTSRLASRQ